MLNLVALLYTSGVVFKFVSPNFTCTFLLDYKLLCLIDKTLILRLLFNMYRKQRIQVRWGDSLSDMFSMSNGVKPGAVLSPYFLPSILINFLKGSDLLGLDAMLVKCMQEHLDMLMTWCY